MTLSTEAQIQSEFALIKAALKLAGYKVGARLTYWTWRIRTPGWVFTLERTPETWTLSPSSTSPSYWKILDIIKTAVGEAREC